MTDPIADMLTRIRNAQAVKQSEVLVPHSQVKFALGEILKREGYLRQITKLNDGTRKIIKIILSYDETGEPVIKSLRRISKPGRRVCLLCVCCGNYRRKKRIIKYYSEIGNEGEKIYTLASGRGIWYIYPKAGRRGGKVGGCGYCGKRYCENN